jgi:hypothetical protein
VTPSGTSAATSTLTINTNTTSAALRQFAPLNRGSGLSGTTSLALFGTGGVLGISLLRRRIRGILWYVQLGLVVMILAMGASAGCGSSGGSGSKTPTGNYQVAITGTAGTTTHSATYSLTVQ